MSRQVPVFGVLLVLSLTASYMRWTAEKDSADADTIYVLEAKPEQITEVIWDSEKLDLTITPQKDALGDWLLVRSTEQKKRPLPKPEPATPAETPDPAAEGTDAAEGAEAPKPEEPVFETYEVKSEFKAGDKGDALWAALAPLEATRALDGVDEAKLEELGLKEPEGTLTIKREGKPDKVLQVGGETYSTKARYVRDVESGRVYLVSDETLRSLRTGATALPDRKLIGVSTEEITDVLVESPAGKGSFKQNNAADPKAAFWAAPGETNPNESAALWINKLLGLSSAEFVQPEETPTSITPALVVGVRGKDGKTVTLEILKGTDPKGQEAWYAKSTYTRQLVKLHASQARDLVDDSASVMAAPE